MEINTRSHESSVRTQGRTVLVIYTSEMHLIRYFWLLDTSGGTSVEINSLAQGLLNHKRGRVVGLPAADWRCQFQLRPRDTSQPDGWRMVGIACSLAHVSANRWSRPSPVEPIRLQQTLWPPLFTGTVLYHCPVILWVNKLESGTC